MSSSSSGTSRCTRMPRFILAGSKAQLEMPMKATCIIHNIVFILLWEIRVSITQTSSNGTFSWQTPTWSTFLTTPTWSTFFTNSSTVHFLHKLQHGPLSSQTPTWSTFFTNSNMVHFLHKHPTWYTFLTNIWHGSLAWQTSNISLSWQTSDMVHFLDKYPTWFNINITFLKKTKNTMVQCPHAFLPPFWQISNMAVHAVDKHPIVHLGKHLTWFILTNI